jgi:ATP-dependent helicase/DNAse subunit B
MRRPPARASPQEALSLYLRLRYTQRMRLITGPAGSGKTTFLLDRFREALRAQNRAVRLLVPTATMARHLENQIAREGFVYRPNLIQTLSRFVDERAADFPQAPEAVLYLLVEEAVARVNRPEFRRVAQLPGFCASLARTIAEFSSAGCDSARLATCLPDAPLASAFLAVYEEVDRMLDARGLLLRAKRLECAAARIHTDGLGGIETVWLNGFHTLPDPELAVIEAIARHADLTIALAEDATEPMCARLVAMGFREERRTKARRPSAAIAKVRAPGIEREVEEIARRILEQAQGRPFREMGIVVRAAETYVPLLRATLEGFGIPARFYFDADTGQHAVTRFLAGALDAMLGGWDHAATLKVLRLAPRFADTTALDRLDFAVREQTPNTGLGGLRALAGNEESPLVRLIDSLRTLEEWRSFELWPADWALRFRTLRNWFRPARPLGSEDHTLALEWRNQAAALDLLDEAFDEAAQALDPERLVGLAEYWRAAKSVIRLKPLRLEDGRRNVVHVLSAHEARQWVLPVVFVCGMVERQFPQFHPQDPFFPDAARCALNAAGIRVRTAAEFEREERALFESALARATMLVTLSYPDSDARGERLLPSLFLENIFVPVEEARAVRPQPRHQVGVPVRSAIRAPGLLSILKEKTAHVSPSGLETFLQCPFQYFGTRLLRLKTAPPRPEDRLDFSLQGSIVHEVLAEWYAHPQEIGPLFHNTFERFLEEEHIPDGYHTERLRNSMLQDLERFAADETWPREGFTSQVEQKFTFPFSESLEINGRIDRIDTFPDGSARVIDYKYSGAPRVKARKDGSGLQAPLYLMAAEKFFGVRPVEMFFVGLKGGIERVGWNEHEFPPDWRTAGDRVLQIVEQIRGGLVAPSPADPGSCYFCDARDVCRIETAKPAAIGGGA